MLRWKFTLNPDTDAKEISEPKGWADLPFTLKRDPVWHGIFFEHSKDLVFYDHPTVAAMDAYTYLRDLYELQGVEGHVILKVELACSDTDDFEQEARWRLNFTKYKETRGYECFITMNLEESDCLMTFKNRYDQEVTFDENLTFDGTQLDDYTYLGFTLTLPPKAVPVKSDIEFGGTDISLQYTDAQTVSSGTGTVVKTSIAYFQYGHNTVNVDEITTLLDIDLAGFATSAEVSPTWIVEVAGDYTLTFEDFLAQCRVSVDGEDGLTNSICGTEDTYNNLELEVWLEMGGVNTLLASGALAVDGCYDISDIISLDISGTAITQTLAPGDEIKIYKKVTASGEFDHDLLFARDLNWIHHATNGFINLILTALQFAPATTTNAYLVNEVGSRIVEKITDDCIRLLSNYYGRTDSQPYPAPSGIDGCGSLRALMGGLDIRQYPGVSRFSISMKKFFEDKAAIDNVGIGLEDDPERDGYQVLRMEDWRYFYENTVVLQLDKIPLVVIEVRTQDHYSIYKGGYSKYEAEAYLGLDEFLTERNYRTSLTSVKNTLDKVCGMIASGYAIEITRSKKFFSTETWEDWRFDDDVFVVCLTRSESTPFVVEQGNITGESEIVHPPSIYNYRISPARNAMRWLSRVLNSYRDPEAVDSTVIFTDGKGNILAEGLMTGDCIVESAAVQENQDLDFEVTDDPADALPIFLPETWGFEIDLSMSQYQTLKAAPRGTIQGRFGQETEYRDFYLDKVEWIPNRQTARFDLLPKRTYPINQCLVYIVQTRGTGTTTFGSSILMGAALQDLFIFSNGNLQKYNEADPTNNEIASWNSGTGYGVLNAPAPNGTQMTIIHLPGLGQECDSCLHRYEGQATGTMEEELTGYGLASMDQSFFFINGRLQKFNDADPTNNEVDDYNTGTEILSLNYKPQIGAEIRAFGIRACDCLVVFNGQGDGTTTPTVSGLGIATLANIFVFLNGSLQKYNDSDTANNEITAYDSVGETVTFNAITGAGRELRAFKLSNDC